MDSRFIVGIDLGTTNSALAHCDTAAASEIARIEVGAIPQVVNPNEVADRTLLPSFLYIPGELDFPQGSLSLPWDDNPKFLIGELARKRGAENPGRLVASAKSWLSYAAANRSAPILPWQAPDEVAKLSPVEVSSQYLQYLRTVWDTQHAAESEGHALGEQDVLLTVPASFDEVARELTVTAARVLVCDVGGGTTDFSLIAVSEEDGDLALKRVAVGEHILLGGDNMDLALARLLQQKLEADFHQNRWALAPIRILDSLQQQFDSGLGNALVADRYGRNGWIRKREPVQVVETDQ